MKQFFLSLAALLLLVSCQKPANWEKVNYEPVDDPFFYTDTCSYPWYIIPLGNGNFESALGGEPLTEQDTTLLPHTAYCVTNHQGGHTLDYCTAWTDNDTLFLHFPPAFPAYYLELTIKVHNNNFKAEFAGEPFAPLNSSYITTQQSLTLNCRNTAVGDSLKGRLAIQFTETAQPYFETVNPHNEGFYIEGVFKTVIENILPEK